jgi:hypothetical protein
MPAAMAMPAAATAASDPRGRRCGRRAAGSICAGIVKASILFSARPDGLIGMPCCNQQAIVDRNGCLIRHCVTTGTGWDSMTDTSDRKPPAGPAGAQVTVARGRARPLLPRRPPSPAPVPCHRPGRSACRRCATDGAPGRCAAACGQRADDCRQGRRPAPALSGGRSPRPGSSPRWSRRVPTSPSPTTRTAR